MNRKGMTINLMIMGVIFVIVVFIIFLIYTTFLGAGPAQSSDLIVRIADAVFVG